MGPRALGPVLRAGPDAPYGNARGPVNGGAPTPPPATGTRPAPGTPGCRGLAGHRVGAARGVATRGCAARCAAALALECRGSGRGAGAQGRTPARAPLARGDAEALRFREHGGPDLRSAPVSGAAGLGTVRRHGGASGRRPRPVGVARTGSHAAYGGGGARTSDASGGTGDVTSGGVRPPADGAAAVRAWTTAEGAAVVQACAAAGGAAVVQSWATAGGAAVVTARTLSLGRAARSRRRSGRPAVPGAGHDGARRVGTTVPGDGRVHAANRTENRPHQGVHEGRKVPAACFVADGASLRCGVPRGRVGRAEGEGAGYEFRRTCS